MKKSVKKNLLKAVVRMAEIEANEKNALWPPICAGIVHQAKRPKKVTIRDI